MSKQIKLLRSKQKDKAHHLKHLGWRTTGILIDNAPTATWTYTTSGTTAPYTLSMDRNFSMGSNFATSSIIYNTGTGSDYTMIRDTITNI